MNYDVYWWPCYSNLLLNYTYLNRVIIYFTSECTLYSIQMHHVRVAKRSQMLKNMEHNNRKTKQLIPSCISFALFEHIPCSSTTHYGLSSLTSHIKKRKCPHRPILWRFSQLSYPSLRWFSFLSSGQKASQYIFLWDMVKEAPEVSKKVEDYRTL